MLSTPTPGRSRTRALVVTGAALAALAGTVLPAAPALADAGNPLDGRQGFLILVEGSATFGDGDTEGSVAVGGDLTVSGQAYGLAMHGAGSLRHGSDPNPAGLVIGGTLDLAHSRSGSTLAVGTTGWVKIGNTQGLSVLSDANGPTRITRGGFNDHPRAELAMHQPANTVQATNVLDFAGMFSTYRKRSADLGACTTSATLTPQGGDTAAIGLTPGRTNVLTLSGDQLRNIATFTFNPAPSAQTPLLINIEGSGDLTWKVPNFSALSFSHAPYILVNVPQARSLTLSPDAATLEGTLFAPGSAVRDLSASNIEGAVVAKSLVAGDSAAGRSAGEVHNAPFAASLSGCAAGQPTPGDGAGGTPTTSPTATPSATASADASPSDPASPTAPASSSASGGHGLPVTGTNLMVIIGIGIVLVGAGMLFVVVTRRRRATPIAL